MSQNVKEDLMKKGDELNQNPDVVDLFTAKVKVRLPCILFSICLCIGELVLDIKLAVNHFTDGNIWFFMQTVCSVVIPALIMTGFNIWWYVSDAAMNTSKVSTTQWVIRILFITLLMAPLLRNFEALYYAIKCLKSEKGEEKENYYNRMIHFTTDAALLTVFEAFMECGPQVVLQIYIFAKLQASNPNIFTVTEMYQVAMISVSLFAMSAAVAIYQRSLRYSLRNKSNMKLYVLVFLILCYFCETASRCIAMGLFASVFPYYIVLLCSIHFTAMFIWIRTMKTHFCENNCRHSLGRIYSCSTTFCHNLEWIGEFVYNLVLGEIFVFCYFNAKENATRWRRTFFYAVMFLENTALICVWYYYYSPDIHFRLPALIFQFSSFAVGIVLMLIYYYFLHPERGKIYQKSTTEENPSEIEMKDCDANVTENGKFKIKESAS